MVSYPSTHRWGDHPLPLWICQGCWLEMASNDQVYLWLPYKTFEWTLAHLPFPWLFGRIFQSLRSLRHCMTIYSWIGPQIHQSLLCIQGKDKVPISCLSLKWQGKRHHDPIFIKYHSRGHLLVKSFNKTMGNPSSIPFEFGQPSVIFFR